MHPKMAYKYCKFCENRTRDTPLQGFCIPKFGKISVKFSVFGALYPYLALMRVKFGMEEWTSISIPHAIFHPIGVVYHPCGAENVKITL